MFSITQKWRGRRHFRQKSRQFLAHSTTFRCWGSFASFQAWGTPGGGSWNVLISGPPGWGFDMPLATALCKNLPAENTQRQLSRPKPTRVAVPIEEEEECFQCSTFISLLLKFQSNLLVKRIFLLMNAALLLRNVNVNGSASKTWRKHSFIPWQRNSDSKKVKFLRAGKVKALRHAVSHDTLWIIQNTMQSRSSGYNSRTLIPRHLHLVTVLMVSFIIGFSKDFPCTPSLGIIFFHRLMTDP